MKQDKHGIFVPDGVKIPLAHERKENTTRIYTTKTEQPMIYSEVKQCIGMYEKEFKEKPKTIVIPESLKDHASELKAMGLEVKLGIGRHYQITLSCI